MAITFNKKQKIKILSMAYISRMQTHLNILMQNYLVSVQSRRKAFLKKLRKRKLHSLKLYKAKGNNSLAFINQMTRTKPRAVWMKKRSKKWWRKIVNGEDFDEWVENFRVDKDTFQYLCETLRPELKPDPLCVREPLSVEIKVGMALYKLASCAEYRVIGNQFGVHKTSVHRAIKQFCAAAIKILLPGQIHMPTMEEAKENCAKFQQKSYMPLVLGAIDGTHIPITPPEIGYRDYINRKSWPSVILQAVVDADYRFMDITIKNPGCTHDAAVLKDSYLYRNIADYSRPSEIINGKEIKAFLIGDPAYPLLDWIMKGYVSPKTKEEVSFGVYLNKARIVVENAFGRLKSRWRILQKRMDVHITLVPSIIATCCILHNIVEERKIPFRQHWRTDLSENNKIYPQPQQSNTSSGNLTAQEIRDYLKNYMADNFPIIESSRI